ncbi:MAG: SMP-30/gluconolactonase/LRE family protein [Saprospiraceae bacterium]|nr:SMP-30/gluconolactonase/LRE family protein [Saprospiraceae bacterium]
MSSINYDLPEPAGIVPEILLDLDHYTEGPVVNNAGHLFFTDLAGQNIWCWKENKAKIWAKGIRPNGQALMADGSLLVCDSSAACIVQYDVYGKIKDKKGSGLIDGTEVRCPNDIAIDPENGFYFTDSVRHVGAVFFVGFSGQERLIADNIDFANGIAISPDGQALYIAESYQNRILVMQLDSPGHIKNMEVFANLPVNQSNSPTGNLPDGLALDALGRLWVAHYGMQAVQVLSASGDLLATYDTGIPLTSNLCFMGNDIIVTGGFGEPGPGRVSRLPIFKTY